MIASTCPFPFLPISVRSLGGLCCSGLSITSPSRYVVCFLELACSAGLPSVAIPYTTCDDFEHQCCQSCLDQDYSNCRVIVCDDSEEDKYKSFVKEFCSRRDVQCILVHRPDRQGYKAGNLNYAISNFVKEDYDYILLVDADQSVPRNFVTSTSLCKLGGRNWPSPIGSTSSGASPLPASRRCIDPVGSPRRRSGDARKGLTRAGDARLSRDCS